jgi:hypothetical protein
VGPKSKKVGRGLHGVLIGSRLFRTSSWTILEKVLANIASCCAFAWQKSSHVGVNMDVLACPCTSWWWLVAVRRGDETLCQVSCYPVVQQQVVASLWRMQSPWTRIFAGVITVWVLVSLSFYMRRIIFTSVFLPYGGVLVVCMRVSLIRLLYQTAMRWIPILECIPSYACGLLQSCHISSGNECYRLPRPWY